MRRFRFSESFPAACSDWRRPGLPVSRLRLCPVCLWSWRRGSRQLRQSPVSLCVCPTNPKRQVKTTSCRRPTHIGAVVRSGRGSCGLHKRIFLSCRQTFGEKHRIATRRRRQTLNCCCFRGKKKVSEPFPALRLLGARCRQHLPHGRPPVGLLRIPGCC